MSNISTKIAIALLAVLAAPGASYARAAGQAGTGNVPISGIPPGPANAGGMNNVAVDPSGNWQCCQDGSAAAAAHRRPGDPDVQVIANAAGNVPPSSQRSVAMRSNLS